MNSFFKNILVMYIVFSAPIAAYANKTLASKNGCLGCHSISEKLVGPSYKDVAEKYADMPNAKALLAQSILQGGSGKWGDLSMPAQSKLSKTDAFKLADWILQGAH